MILRSRRVRAGVALAAVAALTAACSFGPPDPDEQGTSPNLPTPSAAESASADPGGGDQEVVVTVLAKKLAVPWGMAFLPNGSALVTERDTGRILRVGPDSDANGLTVTEVQRLAEVQASGDGGLLGHRGLAEVLDRQDDLRLLLHGQGDNRSSKLVLKGGKLQPILTGIPRSADDNGGATRPSARTVYLYAGTGDGGTEPPARKTPRASAARSCGWTTAGKPRPRAIQTGLPGSGRLGHRNVQGLAWDTREADVRDRQRPDTKTASSTVIVKGKNYGWAKADGPSTDAALTNPLYSWPIADSYCSGVAVADQYVWPPPACSANGSGCST